MYWCRVGKVGRGVNKALCTSNTSEYSTPQEFFDELDKEFHFDLDPCATEANAKCKRYYTKAQDGLSQRWSGSVFMNPPYGRQVGKWVRKAYEASFLGASVVVCLLPARTDTKWFHTYCVRGKVRFIRGRLEFESESGCGRSPFPSMVVVFKGGRT